MWFITAVFITSAGLLQSTVMQQNLFTDKLTCQDYLAENKNIITEDLNNAINKYLNNIDPKIVYQIQWIGCIDWPTPQPKPKPKLKI